MRILLVGIQNRILLMDLRTELLKTGHDTDLLDPLEGYLLDKDGRKILFGKSTQTKNFLKKNFRLFRNFRLLRIYLKSNDKSYDVCNIHFMDIRYFFFYHLISRISQSLIISIYGTDFNYYRRYSFMQKPYYKLAKRITFANQILKEKFNDYYHKRFADKLLICRFGLNRVESLNNRPPDQVVLDAFRNKYSIPRDKILITIGYSSNPIHQQDKAIDEILKLNIEFRNRIFLIFPLTYGGFDHYINGLKAKLIESSLQFTLLTTFLTDEEICCLRLSSDIMINILKYDQLSATLCEYLFAGSYVITGKWLPYSPLDDLGICYSRIPNEESLCNQLTEILHNFSSYKEMASNNKIKVLNFSTWENNISSWVGAYLS